MHLNFINNKIKELKKVPAIVRGNSFSNNFLIALFISAFIIIAFDLSSELAAQKDEIGTALGIFEESYTEFILSIDYLPEIERPILYLITLKNFIPAECVFKSSVKVRGPPEVNL